MRGMALTLTSLTLLTLLSLTLLLPTTQGAASFSTLTSKMYTSTPGSPCIRLLTMSGPQGCGYASPSTSGPLYPLTSPESLAPFVSGSAPSGKYVFVTTPEMFTLDTVSSLAASDVVGGFLLLDGPPPPGGFSPAVSCPLAGYGSPHPDGQAFGREKDCVAWNPLGSAMNEQIYGFSMFALDAGESAYALAKAQENLANGIESFPRNAATLSAFMHATKDTPTCLRRGHCDPVGGASVWATRADLDQFPPKGQDATPAPPTVLLTAAMDTTALFHDRARGANNDISGLVALIGAASALRGIPESMPDAMEADIVFAAFAAEAYGYYGSRMWAADVSKAPYVCDTVHGSGCERPFQFDLDFARLNLGNLKTIVDVRQVGYKSPQDPSPVLYAHIDSSAPGSHSSRAFQSSLNEMGALPASPLPIHPGKTPGSADPLQSSLPPSSLNGLSVFFPDVAGVVLTQHQAEFVNPYYDSIYDLGSKLDPEYVCQASSSLARAAFVAAAKDGVQVPDSLQANCTLVSSLLQCLTEDFECPLIASVLGGGAGKTPSYYTSVFRFSMVTPLEKFVHDILGVLTTPPPDSPAPPPAGDTSHYHPAFSPGLAYDYEDFVWKVINPNEPNVVESMWGVTNIMYYQQDSPLIEGIILTLGIIIAIVSFGLVIAIRKFTS